MMEIAFSLYVLAGFAFAGWFLLSALPAREANAHGAGWGFRLMVLPCCVFLWPFMLVLYLNGAGTGHVSGEWRHADARARRRHSIIWIGLPLFLAILVFLAVMARTNQNPLP